MDHHRRLALVFSALVGVTPILLLYFFPKLGKNSIDVTCYKNDTTKVGQEAVHWMLDKAWFNEQKARGCCPYAKRLYEHRYKDLAYRYIGAVRIGYRIWSHFEPWAVLALPICLPNQ